MKLTNKITAVLLVLLCGLGWFFQIRGTVRANIEYERRLAEARRLGEGHLYQMAINNYKDALDSKETTEIRMEMLECIQQSVLDGTTERNAYINELKQSCIVEPKNTAYWELLIENYININNYSEAHNELRRAEQLRVSSQKLEELRVKVDYSFYITGTSYEDYTISPYGKLSVKRSVGWGTLKADGSKEAECDYRYISPCSQDGTALYVMDEPRLIDAKGVVRAILPARIEKAHVYAEEILPVMIDGAWTFYHNGNGLLGKQFEEISSVQDGVAAAFNQGKWMLVDTNGVAVSEFQFDEIKLLQDGEYCFSGVMVAKRNGIFGLYTPRGEQIAETTATDMDACWGDWIAWRDDAGKWGFMDRNGKITIEPQYDEAKSFSGGLAAVKTGEYWGFINKDNLLAINDTFCDASYFTNMGVCMIAYNEGSYQLLTRRFA